MKSVISKATQLSSFNNPSNIEPLSGGITNVNLRVTDGQRRFVRFGSDIPEHGGIECDLTCARTGFNEYYIVTGTGYATHNFDWIQRNIPDGMSVQLVDITSSNAVLSLFGPKARAILKSVTKDDISDQAQPFATAKRIGIAGCPVLAMRITYVGELGWELHLPTEYA